MMPSPFDLKYFREAATTLNVSRAAERLGISQPSLSLAIQRVEDALGEKVFFRSKRGLTLTPSGKQLLSQTNILIDAWNDVRTKAIASSREIQGRYMIGCHTSVALFSLSGFLPRVFDEQPLLEVQLVHDLSRKIVEGVVSAVIDIGIVVNPVRHPDLIIAKLADDDVAFWQTKTPRQSDATRAVLIYDPGMIQAQTLLGKAAKHGFVPKRLVETKSLELAADLTAHGAGVGVLPTRVAQQARKPLQRIEGLPVFRDEICVVIRKDMKNVAAVRYLVAQIKASKL